MNNKALEILKGINIDFYSGNFYAITGHSGSGKSTLINILGLIDKHDDGNYKLYDKDVKKMNEHQLCILRMENIGFIFQGIYLDPNLSACENVMVPMLINKKVKLKDRKYRAIELLKSVGLGERINHFPKQLSGGEQQRVAIARALANNPSIILADEPTGNLDKENEQLIFKKLKQLSDEGKCIIVVSHSDYVKDFTDKLYIIKDGKLVGETL